MIDIHAHILPGVDDGADSIEEAVAIARSSEEQGIQGIVATPHYLQEGFQLSPAETKERVSRLQQVLDKKGIDVKIYPGAEIFISPDTGQIIEQGRCSSINNGNYILLELPLGEIPSYTRNVFYDLKVMGYQVVLCHPERYREIIDDPNLLYNWIRDGIYAQLNASSLTGIYGKRVKRAAEILIKHNLVQLIGSDVHSVNHRSQCLIDGIDLVRQLAGDRADDMINNNNRMINDKELYYPKPLYYQKDRGLINRIIGVFKDHKTVNVEE